MVSNDNLYKTLKASYDPDACAEAMKEWLEDQAIANERLLDDIADISTDDSLVVEDSIEWWTNLLNSRGYDATLPVQIVDEYYSLGSLVRSAYFTGAGALVTENGEVVAPTIPAIFPEDDPNTGLARLKDVGTDTVAEVSTFTLDTMDDVYSTIKSNLHSVIAMAGAVAASKFESVPERLTYFRDYITRTFSNAYSDISNMANSMTDLLESVKGPSDIIQSLNSYIGLDGITNEDNYTPISNSDVYKFTGSNPAGALDFSTAKSAIKSTVKLAANVVKGVFRAAVSGIKRLFHKIKSKYNAVAVNPVDIAIRDNNAPVYCIDGLHCPSSTPEGDPNFAIGSLAQGIYDSDLAGVDIPSTFVIESWFGHLLVKDLKVTGTKTILNTQYLTGSASTAWTPYFINLQGVIDEIFNPVYNGGEAMWNNGAAFLSALESFSMNGELYLNPSSDSSANNERYLLGGLLSSSILGRALLQFDDDANSASLSWTEFQSLREKLLMLDPRSSICDLPTTVTNMDFFAAATGINKGSSSVPIDNFDLIDGKVYYRSKTDNLAWKALGSYPTFSLGSAFIVYNRIQKKYFPTSYPFCPYTTKRTGVPQGKFYLKTDEQNKKAFNTFFTTAVIAAAVTAVTVVIGVTLKVKAKKAKLRLAGAQRNYENLLSNPNASPKQLKEAKKAYKKAKLQNKLLNSAASGLQTTPSQAATTSASEGNDVDGSFALIKTLITGQVE